MILVEDLRKTYGNNVAVDGVSFQIAHGETLGLLGPNGAGKTTTINMLVGLTRPDSGRIAIGIDDASGALQAQNAADESDGERAASQNDDWRKFNPLRPSVRRQVGVAPQSLSLYDELTAKENLAFFGGLYGLSGSTLQERIQWGLDFAALSDRKNDRIATYSGGMKRRLNIAIALIHEPSILLLDEPTVGVDPQSRNHIFESIQSLKESGLTIIYTTHYMEEAQRLCDRVAIIDSGKLLDVGSVADLISRYGGMSVVTATLREPPGEIELPGELDGLELRFESDQPLEEMARLTQAGVLFQSLQVNEPDLESTFLKLTGRRLRD